MSRACGSRVMGDIYVEVPFSADGLPIEAFLVDPPIVINPAELGLAAQGVLMIEREGVYHLMDWVGENNYPLVADWVEEARAMSVSRKVPRSTDFSKLTPDSRIILVHAKAYSATYPLMYEALADVLDYDKDNLADYCPKMLYQHIWLPTEMCAGVWWDDAPLGPAENKEYVRTIPGTQPPIEYQVRAYLTAVAKHYEPAIFASFPIKQLAVIVDPYEGSHIGALDKARNAHIPVVEVDE